MSTTLRIYLLLIVVPLVVMQTGCGPGDGKLLVEGTASFNGEPINDGYVELHPADGNGQIDGAQIVAGQFLVRTNAGSKLVRITAQRQIGETPPTERIPEPEPIYLQFLPKQFNEASTLTAEVTADDPKIQLDLTGEAIESDKETAAERARKRAQGGEAD